MLAFQIDTDALTRVAGAAGDGLFHIPLLALTILIVARGRKGGIPTADVGTWTLTTLTKHFESLKLSRHRIRWSVPLRRRCADALVFLENVGLIAVKEAPSRTLHMSLNGRTFIAKASRTGDELGLLVRQLDRAHKAVEHSGLSLL